MSDVKRYLPSQIPSCSYNAPEYVLAADFDRLRAENNTLRAAIEAHNANLKKYGDQQEHIWLIPLPPTN